MEMLSIPLFCQSKPILHNLELNATYLSTMTSLTMWLCIKKKKQEGEGRGQPEEKKAKVIPAVVLACNKFLMNFNVSTLLNLFSGVQSQQELARHFSQGHGNHQHEKGLTNTNLHGLSHFPGFLCQLRWPYSTHSFDKTQHRFMDGAGRGPTCTCESQIFLKTP